MELPVYRCHKEVRALKLRHVEVFADNTALVVPEDDEYATFLVDADWLNRYDEDVDDYGYYVVYADGYASWSPTKAFEDGYSLIS